MGRALYHSKAKKRELFNKLKNTPIGYLVREIRSRKVPGLKVGNSWECPGATPHDPRGRSCRGLQKHIYRRMSPSGGEKPLLVPFELAGKPLTRITNRKLD